MKAPSVLNLFYLLEVTSRTPFLDPTPATLKPPLLFAGPKSMQVQVKLDRDDPVYTSRDSISTEDIPVGTVICPPADIWGSHVLHPRHVSSFEAYNIK
jgi:hypothetical protein